MKTRFQILLVLGMLIVATLALGSAASARPLADTGDVGILAHFCDCCTSFHAALTPADQGQEVDMAVVLSRRWRAEQAAVAAMAMIDQVDIAQLRAARDQAIQAAAEVEAAAAQGVEVDMAALAGRRYHAEQLAHAVRGAELALARAGHHM